jgi:hypothetical protein
LSFQHADGPASAQELSHEERQRKHRTMKRQAHNRNKSIADDEKAKAAALGPNSKFAQKLVDFVFVFAPSPPLPLPRLSI